MVNSANAYSIPKNQHEKDFCQSWKLTNPNQPPANHSREKKKNKLKKKATARVQATTQTKHKFPAGSAHRSLQRIHLELSTDAKEKVCRESAL